MKMNRPFLKLARKKKECHAGKSRKVSALAGSVAAIAASMLALGTAKAASVYWDGDALGFNDVLTGGGLGQAGVWNTTTANWWDGGTGLTDTVWNNTNNDTAVFTGTAGTVTLGAPITVGGLQFNTTAYSIGAAGNTNTLTFGAATNTITLNGLLFTATINGSVAGNDVVLNNSAFGGLGVLTFAGTAAGLTGWTGTTTINGNTIALTQNARALTSSTAIALNAGGITLTNTTAAEAALDRVSNAGITANGGTFTVTNTVAAATPYAETIGAVDLVSGQMNIVSTNANTGGTQNLTFNNVFTRAGAANSSALTFGIGGLTAATQLGVATNQINITGQANTAVGAIIGPWATVGTTAALQTDYAVYNINGGTVNALGVQGANIAASLNGAWVVNGNNTLGVGDTLSANRTINTLRYSGAAASLILTTFNLETTGLLNGGSGLLTITFTGGVIRTPTGGGNLYITTGSNAITITTGAITDNGGNVTLVKSGTGGTLTLSVANSYSGGTIINAGTISIPASTSLGNLAGDVTFAGAGGTLSFTASTTLASGRDIHIPTVGGFATFNPTTAAVSTIQGIIDGAGGVIATPLVGGTVTLSGLNTYTGPTYVNTGTLKAGVATSGANGAFGNNTAVVLANVVGVFLDITGFNNTIGSLSGGGATGGTVTLGAATLTTGGNSENTAYAGVISSTGTPTTSLIKNGSGTFTLSGVNTFTGGVTINGGLINITTLGNLGSNTGNNLTVVYDGGGLQFASSGVDISAGTRVNTFNAGGATFDTNGNQIIFANAVGNSGAGGLTKNGLGTLFLQGANTYTGGTTVNFGVLEAQTATALGTGGGGTVLVNNGGTLALYHATGVNFGTKALTLLGSGSPFGMSSGALVNVSGSNTYGGTITLGSSATISADNGTTLNLTGTGNITGTGFGLTLGGTGTGTLAGSLQTGVGGFLTKTGTGTWTVSGAVGNYTGATTINGGKLIVDLTTSSTGVLGPLGALNINGSDLTINGPGNQTIASLNLGAGVSTNIVLSPNGGATTLTITGPGWTRGAGATALFDYSSATTGSRTAIATAVPTGTGGATGTNNILGYALVKDSLGVTGLAFVDAANGNAISRFDSSTMATVLTASSNSATTDYTR
jgi:fibronectin-binding autotransporter adhesin